MTDRDSRSCSRSAPLSPTLSPRLRGEREQRASTPFPPRSGGRAGEGGQTVGEPAAHEQRFILIDIRARRFSDGTYGRTNVAGARTRPSVICARGAEDMNTDDLSAAERLEREAARS